MTVVDITPVGFQHEAFPYTGSDDFVARAAPIVSSAVKAGQPVLVAVDDAKIELLRDRLGSTASSVAWKDIRGIGGNPGRIIPLWRAFVAAHDRGHRLLGFGEPIWPGRDAAELVEAHRHEQLLNLAFAGVSHFTLLCPYDTERLAPAVIHESRRSHPFVAADGAERPSPDYCGLAAIAAAGGPALPEPAGDVREFAVGGAWSEALGAHAAGLALDAGLAPVRADNLAIAVGAVVEAMGRPGAGLAARMWRESGAVLAEIDGLGPVDDPLAGREWPAPTGGPARGLWLANQLCDLVQVRPSGEGAVVRLRAGR